MTRPSAPEIHGTCHPRYARVRDVFAEGFRARDEIGASVAVVADGETVVELWPATRIPRAAVRGSATRSCTCTRPRRA